MTATARVLALDMVPNIWLPTTVLGIIVKKFMKRERTQDGYLRKDS